MSKTKGGTAVTNVERDSRGLLLYLLKKILNSEASKVTSKKSKMLYIFK